MRFLPTIALVALISGALPIPALADREIAAPACDQAHITKIDRDSIIGGRVNVKYRRMFDGTLHGIYGDPSNEIDSSEFFYKTSAMRLLVYWMINNANIPCPVACPTKQTSIKLLGHQPHSLRIRPKEGREPNEYYPYIHTIRLRGVIGTYCLKANQNVQIAPETLPIHDTTAPGLSDEENPENSCGIKKTISITEIANKTRRDEKLAKRELKKELDDTIERDVEEETRDLFCPDVCIKKLVLLRNSDFRIVRTRRIENSTGRYWKVRASKRVAITVMCVSKTTSLQIR